jgi:hypothetical protein
MYNLQASHEEHPRSCVRVAKQSSGERWRFASAAVSGQASLSLSHRMQLQLLQVVDACWDYIE